MESVGLSKKDLLAKATLSFFLAEKRKGNFEIRREREGVSSSIGAHHLLLVPFAFASASTLTPNPIWLPIIDYRQSSVSQLVSATDRLLRKTVQRLRRAQCDEIKSQWPFEKRSNEQANHDGRLLPIARVLSLSLSSRTSVSLICRSNWQFVNWRRAGNCSNAKRLQMKTAQANEAAEAAGLVTTSVSLVVLKVCSH